MNSWNIELGQIEDFIDGLTPGDKARLIADLDLLSEFGPDGVQVKKLRGEVWELKSGRVRLFFCGIKVRKINFVHAIIKKTAKTPLKDLELAIKRCK